jgi:hypothetical protein
VLSLLSVILALLALAAPKSRVAAPETQPGTELERWRTILIDQGALRWRERWPIARPFAVSIHLPLLQDGLTIELRPRSPGWKQARGTCQRPFNGCMAFPGDNSEDYQELGQLAPDQREVILRLRVWYPTRGWQDVGTIRIDVLPVNSVDEVLQPVTNPLWGARLARSLSVTDANLSACLFVGELEWPRCLGCALDVSLMHQGRTVDAGQLWLRGDPVNGVMALEGLLRSIARGADSARGWSLRLQGTSKRLLRTWDATQYWAGEIEVPLANLIRR